MISRVKPTDFNVLSLTTIATPHHGSAFADYMFETIGPSRIKSLYKVLGTFGFETGAFSQLTMEYMQQNYNPKTPNVDTVK
jgi:triacylglycerol lipase